MHFLTHINDPTAAYCLPVGPRLLYHLFRKKDLSPRPPPPSVPLSRITREMSETFTLVKQPAIDQTPLPHFLYSKNSIFTSLNEPRNSSILVSPSYELIFSPNPYPIPRPPTPVQEQAASIRDSCLSGLLFA